MRIQIVNGTKHDLKLEVFDINDKHGSHYENSNDHESYHEFVHRDYCHLDDCVNQRCNKHHHDDIHLDYIQIGRDENRNYDGHRHHNGYRNNGYCEIHGCNLENCGPYHKHRDYFEIHKCHNNECKYHHGNHCNKYDYSEVHRCHHDECKHHRHYDEHHDLCRSVKRVRAKRDKTFEIEFENIMYVKNIDHKICATFGFDKRGNLIYSKCDGIKCEIVKNHKHIQITFN
jgi:hypothetical protein